MIDARCRDCGRKFNYNEQHLRAWTKSFGLTRHCMNKERCIQQAATPEIEEMCR